MEQIYAATSPDDPERLRRVERLLDAGHGECWLAKPEIATLVEESLLHGDGQRYRLLCWVIMPNHVHTLIETLDGHPLPDVAHSWKSFTANVANRRLGRTGHFWARDYFDRYIRDDQHLAAVIRYIENNPVKAGLVERAEDWLFGSARRRAGLPVGG
jgi:putative DNA methylase